jgi:FtsZ-interacting cell division protein YlmF
MALWKAVIAQATPMAPALPVISGAESRGNHPSRRGQGAAPRQPEILVLIASGMEGGSVAIEAVRNGRCVVLDASRLEAGLAQRLADFTRGGVCAMDGRTHRLATAIFLFSPALSQVENQAASSSSWAKRL